MNKIRFLSTVMLNKERMKSRNWNFNFNEESYYWDFLYNVEEISYINNERIILISPMPKQFKEEKFYIPEKCLDIVTSENFKEMKSKQDLKLDGIERLKEGIVTSW